MMYEFCSMLLDAVHTRPLLKLDLLDDQFQGRDMHVVIDWFDDSLRPVLSINGCILDNLDFPPYTRQGWQRRR